MIALYDIQKETINQQCKSFENQMFAAVNLKEGNKLNPFFVSIWIKGDVYKLSDPDPNVIIAQLAKLYQTLKSKKHERQGFDLNDFPI